MLTPTLTFYSVAVSTSSPVISKRDFFSLQIIRAGEGVENGEPSHTVGENEIGEATMENSMEGPQKTKNRTAI